MEWHAVSGQHRVEIKVLERFKCGDPFIEQGVAHVKPGGDSIKSPVHTIRSFGRNTTVSPWVWPPPQGREAGFHAGPGRSSFSKNTSRWAELA